MTLQLRVNCAGYVDWSYVSCVENDCLALLPVVDVRRYEQMPTMGTRLECRQMTTHWDCGWIGHWMQYCRYYYCHWIQVMAGRLFLVQPLPCVVWVASVCEQLLETDGVEHWFRLSYARQEGNVARR